MHTLKVAFNTKKAKKKPNKQNNIKKTKQKQNKTIEQKR